MGKQRYWSGHGRTATATATATASNAKSRLKNQPNRFDENASSSSTSAGCMCAVFQLFDFHPLSLNQQNHHQPPQSPPLTLKPIVSPTPHHPISAGTEAPRNSLESEEESPFSGTTPKQKEDDAGLHYYFPKGIVQIKTKSNNDKGIKGENHLSAAGYSPSCTKTPTLVARLMGLDLLPQTNNSPSTTPRTASVANSPITHPLANNNHYLTPSRSLPETPRTSCERKSNVDNYHHRLSLQIPNYDQENNNPTPSHYAKQIVKQIKETVSRRSGLNDITNNSNYTRRDNHDIIIQTKSKKLSSPSSSVPSPRLHNNFSKPSPKVEVIKESALRIKPKQKLNTTKPALKKGSNKKEESFVVPSRTTKAAAIDTPLNKTKKTPLSNDLLMKKGPPFSSPIKPTPFQLRGNRNQAADETGDEESKQDLQLPSSNHQPNIIPIIQIPPTNNNINGGNDPRHHISTTAATNCDDITAELEYVRQILLRPTSSSLYSSSVFLQNYNTHNNVVSISHRKLLCNLVEELLKPYVRARPYRRQAASGERWPEVVEKLCEKVRKLPRAKCEVLEDIDGIIEKDMDISGMGYEDEGEGIVKEIEEGIVEELLNETVRFV